MKTTAKIAISLPEEMLATIDAACHSRHENRSEFIRQAVQYFLQEQNRQAAIAQYRKGYDRLPESAAETAAALQLAQQALAGSPWE